jgi:hypothetical protein
LLNCDRCNADLVVSSGTAFASPLPFENSERSRGDETDVYGRVLVKGPIPTIQAPKPTCYFFGSNLVANCADYYGFAGFSGY